MLLLLSPPVQLNPVQADGKVIQNNFSSLIPLSFAYDLNKTVTTSTKCNEGGSLDLFYTFFDADEDDDEKSKKEAALVGCRCCEQSKRGLARSLVLRSRRRSQED